MGTSLIEEAPPCTHTSCPAQTSDSGVQSGTPPTPSCHSRCSSGLPLFFECLAPSFSKSARFMAIVLAMPSDLLLLCIPLGAYGIFALK